MPVYRIVWVHGIGPVKAGYSDSWRAAFNTYMQFPDLDFIEVLWDTVFALAAPVAPATGQLAPALTLSPQEQAAEAVLRLDLQAGLGARLAALGHSPLADQLRLAPGVGGFSFPLPSLPPDFFTDAYIGQFTKYLASPTIRSAVKAKVKEQLRPLAGSGDLVTVIAHSWGTAVAYESLMDLHAEQLNLPIANFITLGSPLWVVRPFLDYNAGLKPAQVTAWLNVFAEGDFVGSYLKPSYQVDNDQEMPNFGGGDPHGSYFVPGNVAVQRDLVARAILPAGA
ncbi:MAG: hypothetical protein ACR2JY_12090 [Chloroflexota bacterium]